MKQIFMLLSGLTLVYIMTVVFADSVMEDLNQNIIRFHIIANSNNKQDQEIKLKIRDEILRSDISINDRASAISNMRKIENVANRVLRENGFSYGACVSFGNFSFPEKSYDDITLPAGKYNGIKVMLGKSEGENWWCILSPPACLVEGTVKFDDEALKDRLNDKTFSVISGNYEYSFKLYEIFQKLLKK